MSEDQAPVAAPVADLLQDGIYRDPAIGRWTRLGLAGLAAVAVFAAGVVAHGAVAILVLLGIAVALLLVRRVLGRPRMVVRAEGVLVVRRVGSTFVPWSEVAGAGAVPAPPPLAQVERVLAVRTTGGRQLRVTSLRDAVDRRTGQAPRVAELAAALVARAQWALAPE